MPSRFGGIPVDAAPVATAPPSKDEVLSGALSKYHRGELSEGQRAAVEELGRRGRVDLGAPTSTLGISAGPQFRQEPQAPLTQRQQAMAELAEETPWLEALGVSFGKGLGTVARGLKLGPEFGEFGDPTDPVQREAMEALAAAQPVATTLGEAAGEAAPFLPAAGIAGAAPSLLGRVAGTGAITAAEAGTIAAGRGEDVTTAAGLGAGIGMGAEVLFPVIGKLGRKVFQRVTGKVPTGAMLDAAGRPTQELSDALNASGMTFDDLTQDAAEFISGQKPGAVPGQVATGARAAEAGIPLTRGELTKGFQQQAIEQRLLESAEDVAAEPLRQFKLKQSEAIKSNLRENFGMDVAQEETGQLIQDALTGRKKLLRTQKNELYEVAAENAREIGGVNMFTDGIAEALPDEATMRRLSRRAGNQIEPLNDLLVEFGVLDDAAAVKKFVDGGGEVQQLSIQNFEELRQELGALMKADQSGATSVAAGPVKNALDGEIAELATILEQRGIPDNVIAPMKEARETVRQLKTEFTTKGIIGKVVDLKKDGVTPITEASKVYNKLTANASPVEETRRVVKSLMKSGEKGEQALASLQSSTMLDLIDAGFGTESRKISGVKVFSPIAFTRRLEKIGPDKMKTIFANNKQALRRINNIEKIAADLIPPAGAQPKGSASVILDLMNTLGLASISAKVPGGALLVGSMRKIAQPVKTGIDVRRAVAPEPDVIKFRSMVDQQFPGIASAIGVVGALEAQREVE